MLRILVSNQFCFVYMTIFLLVLEKAESNSTKKLDRKKCVLCISTHTHTHIYTHTCTHKHTHTHIYTHTQVLLHTYTHRYTHTNTEQTYTQIHFKIKVCKQTHKKYIFSRIRRIY